MTVARRAAIQQEMAVLARMQMIVEQLDRCGCGTLEECGRTYRAIRARRERELQK
jgi:hypothetical protein